MKSVLLCEGSTDFALLQYFMRTVHNWNDSNLKMLQDRKKIEINRTLTKDQRTLTIGGCGGCNKIPTAFEFILDINRKANNSEAFNKIVIVTDRDECNTERDFINCLINSLSKYKFHLTSELKNNSWIEVEYVNGQNRKKTCQILLLIVPFEQNGAMETFLLESITQNYPYDGTIISTGNNFVDSIDPEKRYLSKRRYITKAKFDVYFSIRTAVDQFQQRQDILKNIKWEEYQNIQDCFKLLKDI